nr:MAG TPA: hypothetical protein [Caudoviricetes sp.]
MIDVHRTVMNKQRINALKYDVNKIYILVLDKIIGILYYVAKKGSPLEGFYFYRSAIQHRIREEGYKMEQNWKLGDDMVVSDNLLDSITFEDLILTVYCNCPKITEQAVKKELKEILAIHMQDMEFLLENNINKIIELASKNRE